MYIVASADCAQREVERRNTNNNKSLNKKQKISVLKISLPYRVLSDFFSFNSSLFLGSMKIYWFRILILRT
jgi:hypothetical protein